MNRRPFAALALGTSLALVAVACDSSSPTQPSPTNAGVVSQVAEARTGPNHCPCWADEAELVSAFATPPNIYSIERVPGRSLTLLYDRGGQAPTLRAAAGVSEGGPLCLDQIVGFQHISKSEAEVCEQLVRDYIRDNDLPCLNRGYAQEACLGGDVVVPE